MIVLFILIIDYFILYNLKYYQREMTDYYGIKEMWGKIGSGKSTYVTKLSLRVFNGKLKPFKKVYCNMPEVPNTYYFNLNELIEINRNRESENYIVPFDPDSIVVFDEGSLFFNNRDYKVFSHYLQYLFRKCRHHQLYCIVLSQNFDVDKTIRSLASDMSTLHKVLNCISIEKPIYMDVGLRDSSDGVTPGDVYSEGGFFSWRYTFIPKYVKMFNSYERNVSNDKGIRLVYYAPPSYPTDQSSVRFVLHDFWSRTISSLRNLKKLRFFAKKRNL